MKAKYLILCITIVFCHHLHAQDSLWRQVKIDENLTVAIPQKTQQIDTTFSKGRDTIGFKILKAETLVSTLGVTVTPGGTGINIDDEESLQKALNGIEQGTYARAKETGLACKSKDTILDNLPCKKFEFFNTLFKDPIIYNYSFLVNDKLYMFTIAPLHLNYDKAKLLHEGEKFLNSIHFTKTIKERQFATKAESTAYKFGYYLVPFLLIVGFIAFIVVRVIRS